MGNILKYNRGDNDIGRTDTHHALKLDGGTEPFAIGKARNNMSKRNTTFGKAEFLEGWQP